MASMTSKTRITTTRETITDRETTASAGTDLDTAGAGAAGEGVDPAAGAEGVTTTSPTRTRAKGTREVGVRTTTCRPQRTIITCTPSRRHLHASVCGVEVR